MGTSKAGSIIAGISLGLVLGFASAPFFKTETSSWKLIPVEAGLTPKYNNVQYPAYLLNEDTGQVILVGDASYDSDNDGTNDKWEVYNRVLYRGH